jgi:hypothetical protein
MKTIPPIKENQYRSSQEIAFWNFPDNIEVEKLTVKGYLQGERVVMKHQITPQHFDSISYLYSDCNDKGSKTFHKCIGLRDKTKSLKILIME